MNINENSAQLPAGVKILLSITLVVLVCIGDYTTGNELSFSIFYLVPIAYSSLYIGPISGGVLALLGAGLWLWADLAAGQEYSNAAIPVWNALVRLALFIIISSLLVKVKKQMTNEENLADTDPLTGLANRRSFLERFEIEISRVNRYHRPMTLVYFDCDNFKNVNDTKGHEEGDNLLCKVATILRGNLRQTDVIARMGGDEFAIVLVETDFDQGNEIIDKCRNKLLGAMKEHNWPVTFSIGAVTLDRHSGTFKGVIKIADDLMYDMKKSGKNNFKHINKS